MLVPPCPQGLTATPIVRLDDRRVSALRPSAVIAFSLFESSTSVVPRLITLPWCRVAAQLTRHEERVRKDGRAFSPAVYKHGATRGNAGVGYLTALVFDYDHQAPPVAALAPFEHVRYTTHSHGPTDPRWRLVLPTRRSLSVDEYREVWRRAVAALVPGADPACKDPARLHYLPACRPGAPRESSWNCGMLLDPDALPPLPVEPERTRAAPRAIGVGEGEAPGQHFARVTTWQQIVEPHGWKLVGTRGDALDFLRPDNGHPPTSLRSATAGGGGVDVFYVFSGNAAPLEPNTSYTKFGLYAALTHGSDFRAACRALAAQGFGASLPEVTPPAAAVPPPPVVRPGGAAWR